VLGHRMLLNTFLAGIQPTPINVKYSISLKEEKS
jgi:hypothetical protein